MTTYLFIDGGYVLECYRKCMTGLFAADGDLDFTGILFLYTT
jgi:hypothetical protein